MSLTQTQLRRFAELPQLIALLQAEHSQLKDEIEEWLEEQPPRGSRVCGAYKIAVAQGPRDIDAAFRKEVEANYSPDAVDALIESAPRPTVVTVTRRH